MRSFAASAALAVVLVAPPATAATAVRTTASTRQAEVGEGIRIEVSALSEGDDSPSSPRLAAPPGFSVQGPSVSSSQQISFSNGHFEHRRGITATWIVVGTRPGRFVIGPATVQVGRGSVQGETVAVEIVQPGSLPRPPPSRRGFFDPSDPFDPFGMLQQLPRMPGLGDEPLLDTEPEAPPEYQVQRALAPMAFLRATVAPTEAVVGEQVTLRVYAYAGRGPYDETTSSEPSRADFLSQSIIESSFKQPRHVVTIDGARYSVVKLREIALYPLRAGALTIGPMRLGFRGPAYPETSPGAGLVRESQALTVVATEPPLAGRPPGYELGDAGTFTLTAEVEPRRVEAGEAVAATIRVEGTGSVPHHVKIPEAHGVDFLDPTITEGITRNDSVLGGYRQFRYVVRLDEPGQRDLGEVTLPYYDPHSRRYAVARARLGSVEVLPGKAPPSPSPAPGGASPALAARDPFEGMEPFRRTLGPSVAAPRHLADRPAFWAYLAGAPGGVAALRALLSLARRLAARARARDSSRATLARRALDEARTAELAQDAAAVASAVERAIYDTLEDRLELKARAILKPDLPAELEKRGTPAELAADVRALLEACDSLRFAGKGASETPLVERARSIVSGLARLPARPGARS